MVEMAGSALVRARSHAPVTLSPFQKTLMVVSASQRNCDTVNSAIDVSRRPCPTSFGPAGGSATELIPRTGTS